MANLLDLKNPEVDEEPVAQEAGFSLLSNEPEMVSWAAEHRSSERERNREYMLLAGAAFAGGLVAWWQSSWLTFAVVLLCIAVWELYNSLPGTHQVQVDHKGVTVDGYRHRYEHLHSYDMHSMPDGTARLSIKMNRWHLPQLHVPLGDQDPAQIDATLSRYLLRDEHTIPLVEWFLKK